MTRARNLFTWFVFVAALIIAALLLVPSLFGYDRYAIETGSMTGTIDKGSVVYAKPADAADLVEGDIITYQPPPGSGVSDLVTHRIVQRTYRPWVTGADRYIFKTKGDANLSPDPWSFTLDDGAAGLEEAHIPYLGYVYLFLAVPWVRLLLITVPALLILVLTVVSMWREAGREAEEERRVLHEQWVAKQRLAAQLEGSHSVWFV